MRYGIPTLRSFTCLQGGIQRKSITTLNQRRTLVVKRCSGIPLSILQYPNIPIRSVHSSPDPQYPSSKQPAKPKSKDNSQPPIEGATDLSHAHFISSASPKSDFNPSQIPDAGQDLSSLSTSELNSPSITSPNGNEPLNEWQGKLSPTSSHLFKLLIPLPTSSSSKSNGGGQDLKSIQTAFLLHPSQPLSHLSRLIIGSLPKQFRDSEITYLSVTGEAKDIDQHLRNAEEEEQELSKTQQTSSPQYEQGSPSSRQEGGPYLNERQKSKGRFQEVSWSQSTDLSDFVKQSCINEKFKILITPNESEGDIKNQKELKLEVIIPSFASRTHYIRRRLMSLTRELDKLTKQKKEIDYKAHKGAQKLAVAALSGGVVYWGTVIRFTFFTDAGWDLMEPVTWATGFAALLGSAAFLIYHNREVSYSSLLDLSISARQRKLYDQAGLDIEKWTEMVSEAKTLRREITRIASDYDIEWKGELENLAESSSSKPIQQASGNTYPSTKQETSSSSSKDEMQDQEDKLDIDATIQEASDLAEQSESKKSKLQSAQRKGKVIDSSGDGGKNGKEDDRGSNVRKGKENESGSEVRGRKKAEEIIDQ